MGRFSRFVLLAPVAAFCGLVLAGDLYGQARSRQTRPRPAAPPAPEVLPEGVSRGENFSNKQPAALFASDCTGGGCHKSPHGMAKGQTASSLSGFLREHYTNSRESAAALASYLLTNPAGVARQEPTYPRHQGEPKPEASKPPDEANARGRRPPAAANSRNQRGRQAAAEHKPPEPPPPPPTPHFDIFD